MYLPLSFLPNFIPRPPLTTSATCFTEVARPIPLLGYMNPYASTQSSTITRVGCTREMITYWALECMVQSSITCRCCRRSGWMPVRAVPKNQYLVVVASVGRNHGQVQLHGYPVAKGTLCWAGNTDFDSRVLVLVFRWAFMTAPLSAESRYRLRRCIHETHEYRNNRKLTTETGRGSRGKENVHASP